MNPTKYADAGLYGWREKVGERAARAISRRTRITQEQAKLAIGALFVFLSARYLARTIADVARRR